MAAFWTVFVRTSLPRPGDLQVKTSHIIDSSVHVADLLQYQRDDYAAQLFMERDWHQLERAFELVWLIRNEARHGAPPLHVFVPNEFRE